MAEKTLITHERLLEVLKYDPETGYWEWLVSIGGVRAGKPASTGLNGQNYRRIRIDGVLYLAHILAWFYVHGEWPESTVDHEDGDPSNNVFKNLRSASRAQQMMNTKVRKDNSSGVKGVYEDRRRGGWIAEIHANGRRLSKKFWSFSEAVAWRKEMEIRLHGEFARAA